MSFLTGTQTELIYSIATASTNLATFTAEDNLFKTYPPIIIPAGFFLNQSATGKSLKLKLRGLVGTTGTPTFTISLRLLTTTTWSAGGILLGSTNAATAGSTVTLAPWELEVDIVLRTLSIGGASTVVTMGRLGGPGFPTEGSMPANNTSPVVATIDNSVTYYLFASAACGTSNAANLINIQIAKLYGEN